MNAARYAHVARTPRPRFQWKSEPRQLTRVDVQFKAGTIDATERTFEGLLSVWGQDLGDDVMHKGAFKKTLAAWKASPDALPLLNSHNHWDIMSAVGQLLDAKETDDGLWTKWEVIEGPDGDAVLARLRPSARTGRSPIAKMSIGYEPIKWDTEASDSARWGEVRNLREVNLKEGSLVIFPMAPGARIDARSVKAIDMNAITAFTESVTATEPQALDDATKSQLRRLASRIGSLLAPKTAPTTPPAAPAPAPVPTPTQSEPPATPPAPAPAATETPEPESEAKSDDAEPPYMFAEALAQRLLRVTNHNVINNTGAIQ